MIYTELTKKAMNICFQAHKDQLDKSGVPYVFHPIHLAEQMTDAATTLVALLHDVVEDSGMTLDQLEAEGFPPEVIRAVEKMTHDPQVPYMDYVAAIAEDPIAKAVKLADLRHNSDLTRLSSPTRQDLRRREKYLHAIELLQGLR